MEQFVEYLKTRGITGKFTKAGNLNFTFKGRQFQLSRRGWFRSVSNPRNPKRSYYGYTPGSTWYVVFKNSRPVVNGKDMRHACQFLNNDYTIDADRLITRCEKAGLFN